MEVQYTLPGDYPNNIKSPKLIVIIKHPYSHWFLIILQFSCYEAVIPVSWTNINKVYAAALQWALCPHVPFVPLHVHSSDGLGDKQVEMMASSVGYRFTDDCQNQMNVQISRLREMTYLGPGHVMFRGHRAKLPLRFWNRLLG